LAVTSSPFFKSTSSFIVRFWSHPNGPRQVTSRRDVEFICMINDQIGLTVEIECLFFFTPAIGGRCCAKVLTVMRETAFIVAVSIQKPAPHQPISRHVIWDLAERIQAQQSKKNSSEIFHHSGFGEDIRPSKIPSRRTLPKELQRYPGIISLAVCAVPPNQQSGGPTRTFGTCCRT